MDGCGWRVAEGCSYTSFWNSISQVTQCFFPHCADRLHTCVSHSAERKTPVHRKSQESRYLTLPGLSWDCTPYHACMRAQSHSRVQLFVTPWTIDRQAPLPMEFSRQEYWSGLPFTTPGDLPNPGIEPASLASPALACRFFTTSAT